MTNDPKQLLEALGITREDVLNACVEKVLAGEIDAGDWEEHWKETIESQVKERITEKHQELVREALDKLSGQAISAILDKLDKMVIRPTNRFGEPLDKEQTLREYCHDRFEKAFEIRLDYHKQPQLSDPLKKALDKLLDTNLKLQLNDLIKSQKPVIEAIINGLRGEMQYYMEILQRDCLRSMQKATDKRSRELGESKD